MPINEFRAECREFARHWMGVQTEEFKRLGVIGDFEKPLHDDGERRRGDDRAPS